MDRRPPEGSGAGSQRVYKRDVAHSDGEHTDDELLAEIEGLLSDAETSPRPLLELPDAHNAAELPADSFPHGSGLGAPEAAVTSANDSSGAGGDSRGAFAKKKLRWGDDGDDAQGGRLEDVRPFDKREPVEAVAAPPLSPSNEFEWVLVEQLNQRRMIFRLCVFPILCSFVVLRRVAAPEPVRWLAGGLPGRLVGWLAAVVALVVGWRQRCAVHPV
jgi:hypothetical protein